MRWITLALASFFACVQSASAQTDMGSVNVGTSSHAIYSIKFLNPGTIAAIYGTEGGNQNLDFTASGDSCKVNSSYAANSLCTVNVTFSPIRSGRRYGSVVIADPSGTPLGEIFVSGTGMAPQTSFSPATQTELPTNSNSIFAPNGLATDAGGNAYAVLGTYEPQISGGTPTYGSVRKLPANTNADGQFADFPMGLSVDGGGNAYVSDVTPLGVSVLLPNGTYLWARTPVFGVADGAGNLYASCSTGLCKQTHIFGSTYTETTISSITPDSMIFVDGAGDVLASVTTGGSTTLYGFVPCGDTYRQITVVSGLTNGINGLAIDTVGNVYITDSTTNVYKETLQPDGSYVQSTLFKGAVGNYTINWAGHPIGSNAANRLAVDPAGDLYFWKQIGTFKDVSPNPSLPPTEVPYYGLFESKTSTPSTLTFPPTLQFSQSAVQTVTITNSGNEPLQFSAITYPRDFPNLDNREDCSASTTLEPGQLCKIDVAFRPYGFPGTGNSATVTESLKITTNTANKPGTQQSITLTGVELPAVAVTPTISFSKLNATMDMVSITGARYETFYVTTDGSNPTTSSSKYGGPFPAAPGTIIKAFGTEGAYRPSPVATATAP